MRIFSLLTSFLLILSISTNAQENESPKAVIGIVVDQMRYDYLLRFKEHYGENGLKRLMEEGKNFKNTNYNYKPTKTAPGHASIFTGTTPSVHGIVGNNWYSRAASDYVYCVKTEEEGKEPAFSPARMQVNTLADEMKLMDPQAKVYGISLKDRGAILPAGHTADGAYWFEGKQGGFVTSAYYTTEEEGWLKAFNKKDVYKNYLAKGWKLSAKEEAYADLADNRAIERPYTEGGKAEFPYDFKLAFEKYGADLIKQTPQGNEILADFAKELIKEKAIGKDEHMDFLSISFSSTDYIGHQFGVRSREVMDVYIKLDQILADLLTYLDQELGGNYLLFLTSDHGAAVNREHLKEMGVPSGHLSMKGIQKKLDGHLDSLLGEEDWIKANSNLNIYFDQSLLVEREEEGYEREDVMELSYHFLKAQEGVANVYLPGYADSEDYLIPMTARGYHADESGDLVIIEKPNWNSFWAVGSGHESPYNYDTHVPLLIYGKGVGLGESNEAYSITDIIPSLANHLGLGMPDGVKNFKSIPLK